MLVEFQALLVEVGQGAKLFRGRTAEGYVGLARLFHCGIQAGVDTLVVRGCLALVHGAGRGQNEWKLASLFTKFLCFGARACG